MRTLLLLAIFAFSRAQTAQALPITFQDFNWGTSLYQVELKAGSKGFDLKKKINSVAEGRLVYATSLRERDCIVSFIFTPLSKKLCTVTVTWEGASFGYILLDKLKARYKTPREEIPQAKLYIWTRKHTEIELRHDGKRTVLTYSDLNLWNKYHEERKWLEKRNREEK